MDERYGIDFTTNLITMASHIEHENLILSVVSCVYQIPNKVFKKLPQSKAKYSLSLVGTDCSPNRSLPEFTLVSPDMSMSSTESIALVSPVMHSTILVAPEAVLSSPAMIDADSILLGCT
jgi:hypothetical protein